MFATEWKAAEPWVNTLMWVNTFNVNSHSPVRNIQKVSLIKSGLFFIKVFVQTGRWVRWTGE